MSRPVSALVFLAAFSLSIGFASSAHAGAGTIHGVVSSLTACQGCHSSNQPDAGGLNPEPSDGGENLGGWPDALVDVAPTNTAAADAGKMRVHSYVPWNSYLLDKLTGDLKDGEGDSMRSTLHPDGAGVGSTAEISRCPGLIDEISNWILGGAPGQPTVVEGDYDYPIIHCDRRQQPMGSLALPDSGFQVNVDELTVEQPDREAFRHVEGVSVGNVGAAFVNRIEVLASAGTESVAIWRAGDDVPLVVARGQMNPAEPYNRWDGSGQWEPDEERVVLDVQLPEGVAVSLADGQTLTIEQRIRNDYWVAPDVSEGEELYRNVTTGDLVVNLHTIPAGSVEAEAQPILDANGTDLLVTAPDLVGVTGGAWQGGFAGGLFGIWTDHRAIEAAVTAPLSTTPPGAVPAVHAAPGVPTGVDVTRDYAPLTPQDPTAQVVAYTCVHSNGFTDSDLPAGARPGSAIQLLSRPARYACIEGEADHADIVQNGPREVCHRASDCEAPTTCQPVPLVGGDAVDDGRCTLIGLVW